MPRESSTNIIVRSVEKTTKINLAFKNKKTESCWKDNKRGAAEKHLMSRGVQKIYGVIQKKYINISYLFFSVLAAEAN